MTHGGKPQDPARERPAAAAHRAQSPRRARSARRSTRAPAPLRIAAASAVAALTLGLSGCDGYARDDVLALCTGFERSWNDLMQARADTPPDEDIREAVQLAGERWIELSEQTGPDDLTDMLAIASSNLSGLRGAPDAQQRKVKVTSLRNSAGYIDLECGKAGAEMTLAPLASLVTPRQGE